MNIRKNPEGLAIFNKIMVAEQILDRALQRTPPREYKKYIEGALEELNTACELLEIFVEGMKGGAA